MQVCSTKAVFVPLSTLNGAIIRIQDLKLPQQVKLIKFSHVISHVSWLKITDISGTISAPIIRVWSDIRP
jgi:hypothetical protein